MKLQSEIKSEIARYSKELRLPVFRNELEQVAQESAKDGSDYETFLLRLMEREYDTRLENRKKSQIRQAGFPAKLYLHDLKRDLLPVDAAEKLTLLERLDFVASGRNIILAGNPGTGKTHIATGLGLKACLQGYKVYFTTVHGLLTQLRESHAQRTLRQMELRFEKYDLVICDEFGYISFDKQGAELLFNHLSLRAGRSRPLSQQTWGSTDGRRFLAMRYLPLLWLIG
jgi:DNA replication protein DnaC